MRALACTDVVVIADLWSEPVILKRGIWRRDDLPETTSCHCPAVHGEDCPLTTEKCFTRATRAALGLPLSNERLADKGEVAAPID